RDLLDSIRTVHAGSRHVQTEVAAELGQHAADQSLTEREVAVLKLIAHGCSNKIVADRLNISEDTVKGHGRHILSKLKANDEPHAGGAAPHGGYFESDLTQIAAAALSLWGPATIVLKGDVNSHPFGEFLSDAIDRRMKTADGDETRRACQKQKRIEAPRT